MIKVDPNVGHAVAPLAKIQKITVVLAGGQQVVVAEIEPEVDKIILSVRQEGKADPDFQITIVQDPSTHELVLCSNDQRFTYDLALRLPSSKALIVS